MKKKILIYALIILFVLLICMFACLPKFKKEYKIFIKEMEYGNLQDLIEYHKEDGYEIKSVYETLSFTIGEERMSYHLVSVTGFENLNYHSWSEDNIDFKLLSGAFPKTDSEIIVPDAFNNKYKIGDTITLNMSNVYGTKSDGEKVIAEKTINNFIEGSLEYEDETNKKQFTIVGFYDSVDNVNVKNLQNGKLVLPYLENDVIYLEVPFFTSSSGFEGTDNVYSVVAYKSLKESKPWKDEYVFLKRYKSSYGFETPTFETLD